MIDPTVDTLIANSPLTQDWTQPLRVVFVNSGLGYGGAETQLIAIIGELKRIGHEPALYLLTREAPRVEVLLQLGVPVIIDSKSSKLDWRVIGRMRTFLRNWRADLVHGFLFDANIYSRLAAIGLGIPILNSERSLGYRLSHAQWVIHKLTRWMVDGVVANSHSGRAFAQGLLGLPPLRTHVVWNGINLDVVDRARSANGRDYRLEFFGDKAVRMATLVGSINPQKDHMLALRVAEALIDADPSWRVSLVGAAQDGSKLHYQNKIVAGSVELKERVYESWRASRHHDKIQFVGRRDDALQIIAASDVLFSTSMQEGFPNVVLEAMAVGTPVVSTAYSDIHMILEDPNWVIESRDPRAIAEAIRKVYARRDVVGPLLRRWVEEHATITRSVRSLLTVYSEYLNR